MISFRAVVRARLGAVAVMAIGVGGSSTAVAEPPAAAQLSMKDGAGFLSAAVIALDCPRLAEREWFDVSADPELELSAPVEIMNDIEHSPALIPAGSPLGFIAGSAAAAGGLVAWLAQPSDSPEAQHGVTSLRVRPKLGETTGVVVTGTF